MTNRHAMPPELRFQHGGWTITLKLYETTGHGGVVAELKIATDPVPVHNEEPVPVHNEEPVPVHNEPPVKAILKATPAPKPMPHNDALEQDISLPPTEGVAKCIRRLVIANRSITVDQIIVNLKKAGFKQVNRQTVLSLRYEVHTTLGLAMEAGYEPPEGSGWRPPGGPIAAAIAGSQPQADFIASQELDAVIDIRQGEARGNGSDLLTIERRGRKHGSRVINGRVIQPPV